MKAEYGKKFGNSEFARKRFEVTNCDLK